MNPSQKEDRCLVQVIELIEDPTTAFGNEAEGAGDPVSFDGESEGREVDL